ncbi:MAG: flagellar basal body rod protein FlgB [Desulfotalea sp.]
MNTIQPFDSNTNLLSKVLDLRANKQEIISSNIANAETPGYAPARFNFEQELEQAISNSPSRLTTTQEMHIPLGPTGIDTVNGSISIAPDKHGLGDENGVSVQDEMLALSENQLLYETALQLLNKKLGMIKYAISGGQ